MRILEGGTVDVVMSETSLVYLEGLRYRPRPVIQSYAAYDAYLDQVNADKLQAPGAPDFILFHVHPGGDRYWFSEETRTRLAILQWYDDIGRFENFLVLKRRARSRTLLRSEGTSGQGRLGRPLGVSSEPYTLTVGSFAVRYSLLGQLARILLQPPRLDVTLRLRDGASLRYRATVPLFRDGVVIDRFVAEELGPARAFLDGAWDMLPPVQDVTFDTSQGWGFRDRFDYLLQRVHLTPEGGSPGAADGDWASVEGDTLLLRLGGALPQSSRDVEWSSDACGDGVIERVTPAAGTKIEASGWAFVVSAGKPADAVFATTGAALQPGILATALVGSSRPDVAQVHGQNARTTGWHLTVAARGIDPRKLRFWAFDMEARRAYPLCSAVP
ncbi:MAG: hypothetical protein AUG74_16935 [Bacteroidetes bacterium 13_1_20CM_4_60_6]|nr:MAG: hypothetical protein AUG74_16935 [Bacteroidetes bacterium 13_1_20CM_4_60_6]